MLNKLKNKQFRAVEDYFQTALRRPLTLLRAGQAIPFANGYFANDFLTNESLVKRSKKVSKEDSFLSCTCRRYVFGGQSM